jgi:HK97 family phage portal protein
MGLLDRVAKYILGGGQSFQTWIPIGDTFLSRTGLIKEYKNIVYACVRAISEDVGRYEPKLYRGDKPLVDHRFLNLIHYPNEFQTQYDLFELTQTYIELTGECFWYLELGEQTRLPRAIQIIRPDVVEIAIDDKTGKVIGYTVTRKDGTRLPLNNNEVIHFKSPNPIDPYRGLGTVEAGLLYIETETSTSTFQRNFLKNQATPSGVVSLKGKISREAFSKLKKQWKETHSGLNNAGKTLFIREADATFEKIGLSLADINMEGITTLSEDKVLKMFRVPAAILGKTDSNGLGRANIEAVEYIFAKRTIEPKLNKFDDMFTRKLKEWYKEDLTVTHTSQVPADDEFALLEDEKAVDKWMTRNEIRERRGLEPIKGGDKLYVPFNQIEMNEKPVERSFGKIKILKTVEKEDPVQKEVCGCGEVHKGEKVEKASPLFTALQNIEDKTYKTYQKNLVKLTNKQEKEVIALLGGKKQVTTVDLINFSLVFSREDLELNLLGVLFSAIEESGKLGIDLYGEPDQEFILLQSQRDAIFESTERQLKTFNEETALKLQKQLAAGMQEGENVAQLTKRVKTVFGEIEDFRAERIARTESHTVINEALADSFYQSGFKKIVWKVNPGACKFCQSMAGKEVTIGQPFIVQGDSVKVGEDTFVADYTNVKYCNLHPNCACYPEPVPVSKSLKPVVIKEVDKTEVERLEKEKSEIEAKLKESEKELKELKKETKKQVESKIESLIKEKLDELA